MRIQDIGIWTGIFFVCISIGLSLVINAGSSFHVDFSSIGMSYIEYSPYIVGGFGVFLAVISLISLAKSK